MTRTPWRSAIGSSWRWPGLPAVPGQVLPDRDGAQLALDRHDPVVVDAGRHPVGDDPALALERLQQSRQGPIEEAGDGLQLPGHPGQRPWPDRDDVVVIARGLDASEPAQ